MPDITRNDYQGWKKKKKQQDAINRARNNRPEVRQQKALENARALNAQNKADPSRIDYSGVNAYATPPVVRSKPIGDRREIDKQFISDMQTGSANRFKRYNEKAPSHIGEITAARNQVAANLSNVTRMQAQYAGTDDQEMKDLLAGAYGEQMGYNSYLDSLSEYIRQFDTPQQQKAYEFEDSLDEQFGGMDYAGIEEQIAAYEADLRAEKDPANRSLIQTQIDLLKDYARSNPATRTPALRDTLAEREQDLIDSTAAYGAYNEAARNTTYDAVMADNYLYGDRPSDDAIIARIDYAWQQRETELRSQGVDEATIAEYHAAYESAKDDPALWWANQQTAQQDLTTPEEMAAARQGIEGVESPWHIEQNIDRLNLDISESESADRWREYEKEAANSPKWDGYFGNAAASVYAPGNDEVLGNKKRRLMGLVPTKYDNMYIPPEYEAYYQYIKDTYGADMASEYAEYAESAAVDPALVTKAEKFAEDINDSNAVDRTMASAASRLINSVSGLPGAADAIGTTLASWISGQSVAPGAAPFMPYVDAADAFSETIDAGISEDLNSLGTVNDVVRTITGKDIDVPAIGNMGWGDAYQSVASRADSILSMVVGGKAGFAANVASDAYHDAFEKGYSDDQSIITGLASVLTEALPEYLSIDFSRSGRAEILKYLKSKGGFTLAVLGQALGKVGLSAGLEGVQEGTTTFMNQGLDRAVGGQNSDYWNRVKELSGNGLYMTDEEAVRQADREQWENVGRDAASGFVGSLLTGAGDAAANVANEIDIYSRVQKGLKSARETAPTRRADAKRPSVDSVETTKAKADERMATMKTAEGEASMVGDKPVKVHAITKTGDDATVRVTDESGAESEVKLADVAVGKDTRSEVYAYAADMATPELANTFRGIYKPGQSIESVAHATSFVYEMAEGGMSEASLRNSSVTTVLDDEQFQTVYKLAKDTRVANIAKADEKATERLKSLMGNSWRGGTLKMGEVVEAALSGKQREDVELVRVLAGISGMNVELFQSTANAEGRFTRENGSYNRATNTIYLDVNAGRDYASDSMAKTALLRTMSHEMTHAIQANSPAIYGRLQEAVLETLSSQGVDIEDRIARVMTRDSSVKTRAAALDEIVADACETMLRDSEAAQRFKEAHPEEARTLGQKILEFIKNLTDAIKRAFAGEAGAKSAEAKALLNDMDAFRKVAEIWTEGAVQTGEVMGRENGPMLTAEASEALESVGIAVDMDTASASPQFSARTWRESDYVQDIDKAADNLASAIGVPKAKALRYIKSINSVARLVMDDVARLDYEANPNNSVLKPNSEYVWSVDMSTLCAKRLLYTGTVDAIQKALPNAVLTSEDIVALREMMQERNYEVACGICYVESTRREIGRITQDFLDMYNAAAKDGVDMMIGHPGKQKAFKTEPGFTPTLVDFNTAEGIDNAQRNHKEAYAAYLAFMNARVQAKPKLLETRTEYRGDILKNIKTAASVKKLNAIGGLRVQSFSDFEVPHMIDMMQVMLDASQVGLTSQAYTKVPEFAEVFGRTGMKINLSLIAKGDGLDENGNLVFDDVEGMPADKAFVLRKKYSKNVGTILVGKNDEHIIKALADDRIDFVIPFHKSSWKESLYKALGLTGYSDYTSFQNEHEVSTGKTVKKNLYPSDYWDYSKSGDENAQIYLEKCREMGRIPKFPQFQGYPGYWKLLIDFRMYDNNGIGVPQSPVTPDFNMTQARKILKSYEGGHRSLPVAQDVVDDFVAQYKERTQTSEFNADTQFSTRDYSYAELVARPDMTVTVIANESLNRDQALIQGKQNVEKYTNRHDMNGAPQMYVKDLGKYVTVGNGAMQHGLGRDAARQNNVVANIGDILNNAIVVNEARPKKDGVRNTWLLLGAAVTEDGVPVYVRFVVNQSTGHIDKMTSMYAVRGKEYKNRTGRSFATHAWQDSLGMPSSSKVSIASLLENVKGIFDDVISADVAKHLGIERSRSEFSDALRFSTRDPYEVSDREILANAFEDVAKTADEKAWLAAYKKDLAELNSTQAVLDENRAVVRELLFKAGRTAEETDRLKKATERVKTLSERLAKRDAALLKVEAAAPLRAIVDREGKKVREKMRQKEREDIAKIRQTQENAAYRQRIVRKVKKLDELLRNPTDQKHVPDELKMAVLDMLKPFTEDTSVFDKEKLARVRREYAILAGEGSATTAAGMYDEDTAERIETLIDTIGGQRLSKLSREQLDEVTKVVDHFAHLIKEANTIFVNGRRERVDALAMEVAEATQQKGIYMENKANMNALWKLLSQGQITPAYFFRRLGGAMGRLGNAILDGENRFGVNAMKSRDVMTGIMAQYNHKKWAGDKKDVLSFVTEEGEAVTVTREQALSLYATNKRERGNKLQNASHLRTGGIIIQQGKLGWRKRESNANATPISSADMEKINAWLTAEQKAYADAMVEYISKDMSELGNETSRALHGYSKFGEGYYFPYKTSSDFRKTNLGDSETALLKSMGFTKSVVRNANTPIIVGDFTETVSEHVAKMLMYNSFAEAQDAFMRVYDYKLTKSRSVKSAIKTAWGKNVTDYIEQFMRDVYGGITRDQTDALGDKLLSTFKKNAVLASASVAIQQPSALMRAMAYIDPKYFGGKPMKGGFREAMQYAGTAVIKDIGRFDTNTGRSVAEWMVAEDYQGVSEKSKALLTDADYRSDVLGLPPEKMDQAAWGIMWNAVKREQAAVTGLDINSEALKEIAGRRFDEVMRYTQVYDSVMSRSQVMRSKTTYAKMLTAFMAEPTVTYNMFVDAWFDKQTSGKAKAKRVTRTMAALTGSILLNNLLKAIVSAARDDDDENETYRERYVKNFSSALVADLTPLNYIPYAKDIMSIFQGYDVERSDMAIISDMYAAMQTLADDKKSLYERTKSFATVLGMATGLPIKNIWRDFEAGYNTFDTVKDQRVLREGWLTHAMKYGSGELFGVKDTKANSTAKLLKAAISGDFRAIDGLREHMSAYNGMDEKQINSALANAIHEALEGGEIDSAQAQALLMQHADHDEDEAETKFNKWLYEMDTGSNYSDMKDRFLAGEISEEDAVQARMEYGGVSEEKARKTVHEWRFEKENSFAYDDMEEAFKDGDITKQHAISARIEAGADEDDAYWDVTGWEYEKQTGDEWKGRATRLRAAMEGGKLTDIEAAITELYDHTNWKNPSSELTGEITAYWKPLYVAAAEEERKAMLPLIYDCYELAYTLNGETYYGDNHVWKNRIKRWEND